MCLRENPFSEPSTTSSPFLQILLLSKQLLARLNSLLLKINTGSVHFLHPTQHTHSNQLFLLIFKKKMKMKTREREKRIFADNNKYNKWKRSECEFLFFFFFLALSSFFFFFYSRMMIFFASQPDVSSSDKEKNISPNIFFYIYFPYLFPFVWRCNTWENSPPRIVDFLPFIPAPVILPGLPPICERNEFSTYLPAFGRMRLIMSLTYPRKSTRPPSGFTLICVCLAAYSPKFRMINENPLF